MNGPDFEDDELRVWENFRKGEKHASAIIIKRYAKQMLNYGFRFCRDKDFLKDCIQDVFIELWSRRDKIDPNRSVKWYLLKSLRFRIFSEYPRWNSNDTLNEDYNFTAEFSIEDKLILDDQERQLAEKVKKILAHMPSRQKEILYLRFYEDFSSEEIAKIMLINKQSVYNLIQKAYSNFRSAWHLIVYYLTMSQLAG